jgi:hypothetical protein
MEPVKILFVPQKEYDLFSQFLSPLNRLSNPELKAYGVPNLLWNGLENCFVIPQKSEGKSWETFIKGLRL